MKLSNTDFTVLYVDPSAASAGDGSTPASAMKSLPASTSDVADETCFIIRRTSASHEVQLPQGENANITALAFIGMPKETDELYSLMPDEAKTAWGGDSADYANILAVTSSEPYGESYQALRLPNCLTFFLYRVNLYRENQGAVECAIQLNNDKQTGTASIERCRFGLKGFNLEDSDCTVPPSYGAAMYFHAGKIQVFSFRHNIVTAVPDSGYYYEAAMWGIEVQSASFVDMFDVDVWCATAQYGGDMGPGNSDPVIKFGYYNSNNSSYSTICGNINVDRIRCHYVRNGSCGYLPGFLYVYGNEFTSLRNVSICMESRQLGSGTPSVVSPCTSLLTSDGAAEYIYENLTATLPQVWRLSGCNIFKLCGSAASNQPGCAKKIENIAITLGTTGGIDSQGNGNYYSDYKSTDTSQWSYHAALCLAISSNGMSGGGGSCHEPVIVRNINVVHPRGMALYATNCYLKNVTLQGMLRVSSVTCDVVSLATWYPGYAICAQYGSTVRVGTLTLGKGNIAGSDSDPAILGSPQESYSFIYVGTSNGALMSDTRSTNTSYSNSYAVICANEQDTGHYTMRTINGMVNTWGVVRTGSSVTASLKLSNNTGNGPGYMSLGRQPFGGFAIPATAGQKTLKVHVATKGLSETDELDQRLVAQVAIPQADGSKEMVFSSTRGRWTTDSSTWIGESGLSGFLLEIPLDIPDDCNVDVKLHFRWYSAGGYLYIDPDMKIE